MNHKKHMYRKLFSSTFYLSAFTFGGGYVIIPLMQKKFVDDLQWIDKDEMLNLVAIAQTSPGPIVVNISILLGYHMAGILGAMATVLGAILPPLIIISIISLFYTAFRENIVVNAVLKGMQAGVAAIIANVVLNLGGNVIKKKDLMSTFIMVGAFMATFFLKINVMYIILVCGCIGAGKMMFQERKTKKDGDAQ